MIVDFQHHFTPRELIREDPGDGMIRNTMRPARRAIPRTSSCTISTSMSA
jgi:hypothetical protein